MGLTIPGTMRILYIHQYFASRKGKTGTRSYEFGRYLAGRGHEVTMITSGLANVEFPVCPNEPCCEYRLDGMRVISIAAAYNDPNLGTALSGWRRMLQFHRFTRLAVEVGRCLGQPEVVFATHTPLTVGLAGIELSRYFKAPFVFEVRDLWPEALVNVGALNNPAAVWWLRRMARHIYRAADHIVALSPGMKDGIVRAGIASEKVTVIPNGSDLDLFHPGLDGSAARARLGLGRRFAAIYFGAMGLANGLEYVIEAARILAERAINQIVLVLLGSGGRQAELENLVRTYGLNNVVFCPAADKEEVARLVAGCDVCLTIYRAAKEHTWSPNKLFDALAAGKPVLLNVPGWLRETVEQNHGGRYVDPCHPEALAAALEELSQDPALCRQMGENARVLAERQFDRRLLAAQLEQVFQDVVTHV
jgi:glycosyltransferase involved in cell wall biosynthesis